MNMLINADDENVLIVYITEDRVKRERKRGILGVIDYDESLIKYLLNIFSMYELNKDNGYLKFENKDGEVYLHRIIMEYYSKYDTKLYTVLNSGYEVNHKNFNKWDNRIKNLEMVTRLGNERHKRGMYYEDEIAMTSEEIIKIQNERRKKRQHFTDKRHLEKVNFINLKLLDDNNYYNSFIYENLYIRFNNVNKEPLLMPNKRSSINTLTSVMSESMINFINAQCTYLLVELYDVHRARTIIQNNIQVLNKYYNKTRYFKYVCDKFLIKEKLEWIFQFLDNKPSPEYYYTFYKNELCFIFSINSIFTERGKYTHFKMIYRTGLLKRAKVNLRINSYGGLRSSSKIIIPIYTDKLFSSTILPESKHLHSNKYKRITSTILLKNEGEKVADKVYKNPILLEKAKFNLKSIEDIENILISPTITDKIHLYGFVKVQDIREELRIINEERKSRGEFSREITCSDDGFIKRIITNIDEITEIMKQNNIEYIIMNKKTKERIQRHQKKNGIEDFKNLRFNQNERVIILKKLYTRPKQRKMKKK